MFKRENLGDVQLYQGDALASLLTIEDGAVDAVITDPPYSSGGAFRSDRILDPDEKYVQGGTLIERLSFTGDNRDGRSWGYWMTLWLGQALRVTRPGGYCLIFSDWRQLPLATDVFQAGGWVWRGIIIWDKTGAARAPHPGYFRHQAEYIVWGTRGNCSAYENSGGPFPGVYKYGVRQDDKYHMTGKPTPLMRDLVKCVPPGGIVLDPFMGSGTTGVGALMTGRRFIGMEYIQEYIETSKRRLAQAQVGLRGLENTFKAGSTLLSGLPLFDPGEDGVAERRLT